VKLALTNDVVYQYAIGEPSATGGAERAQWLLARALTKTGWSVAVGVRKYLLPQQDQVVDGVRFVGMEPTEKGTQFLRSWARFLDSERPDWWYWRGADPLWGALLLISKRKRIRGIFSAAFDRDVHPRIALTRRQYWWPLYAWSLNAVERIFVQHRQQFSELNEKFHPKASIVPGVVALCANPKPYSERGKYVAWTAVLRQPKRPDLLVEIARKSPDLRYVVCGGTSVHRTPAGYSERIVSELRSLPNVEYLGHVSPQQSLEIIGNATALLSTSDQEGFPNTFLEAWSAGTPVVTLRVDPGGMIRERGLGFVSGGVDRALVDIRRLLNGSESFDMLSTSARKYIQEVHSDTSVARAFNNAILGVN
jgi:glycosyltransferase involved in cell wall biosynthesis